MRLSSVLLKCFLGRLFTAIVTVGSPPYSSLINCSIAVWQSFSACSKFFMVYFVRLVLIYDVKVVVKKRLVK